ncbi:hypothetical protein IQ270_21960 [Microcoleus sp. LEGE 07076]|uniref:hypothetical protein n=1 Tax=Microcoleus sp. LEGE 07076 TaxID=915322 RepID=UPI00187FE2DF|nr:hypothetical protein [Microcoleus sp. LEGE 07076]MBE9187243.1 hypothetical protein [Microcoleus sp. LEGE 07076]
MEVVIDLAKFPDPAPTVPFAPWREQTVPTLQTVAPERLCVAVIERERGKGFHEFQRTNARKAGTDRSQ